MSVDGYDSKHIVLYVSSFVTTEMQSYIEVVNTMFKTENMPTSLGVNIVVSAGPGYEQVASQKPNTL